MSFKPTSRRDWFADLASGLGGVALASMLPQRAGGATGTHFAPKAKRVLQIFCPGAASHVDLWDYKPELQKRSGEEPPHGAEMVTFQGKNGALMGSPWEFKPRGQCGLPVSDLFPHQAQVADELCVLSGMHTDISNHTPAMLQLHTGSFQFTRPSLGAWVLYGLGSANQNLPGFVTINPPTVLGGAKYYGSSFLPAAYQGTPIGGNNLPLAQVRLRDIENRRLTIDHRMSC